MDSHQEHLKKRREYYRKNWNHIRQRDNANAKRLRQKHPQKYKKKTQDYLDKNKKKETSTTKMLPLT
ncbi:hypothetical protein [Peptococcus simiae]|uniref:hypothetical protein n=1 Tax=Peptococcus simiae TaxID=1643805 RepID=UPI00398099F2